MLVSSQLPKARVGAASSSEAPAAGLSSAAPVQVAVVRMVQQLSQVYSKLHMSTLQGMVPFYSIHQTEKVIVEAIRHNFLHVSCPCRHKEGCRAAAA